MLCRISRKSNGAHLNFVALALTKAYLFQQHLVVQNAKGFIWVSTIEGLMRYHGYHFVAYKNNYYDSASSDNTPFMLLVGKDNKLWQELIQTA